MVEVLFDGCGFLTGEDLGDFLGDLGVVAAVLVDGLLVGQQVHFLDF